MILVSNISYTKYTYKFINNMKENYIRLKNY